MLPTASKYTFIKIQQEGRKRIINSSSARTFVESCCDFSDKQPTCSNTLKFECSLEGIFENIVLTGCLYLTRSQKYFEQKLWKLDEKVNSMFHHLFSCKENFVKENVTYFHVRKMLSFHLSTDEKTFQLRLAQIYRNVVNHLQTVAIGNILYFDTHSSLTTSFQTGMTQQYI